MATLSKYSGFARKAFPFLVILAAVLAFFPEVVFLNKGFLSGDHRLQHYPWFYHYWQNVRQCSLPWWTTLNQCGFPLLAEGQIGAFYPLNFLFALLLPVRWGYNYSVLMHYFLAGLFFFLYARKIRLGRTAAMWGTLIFLFGSCQGGFFYNITSQRTLVWFPLTLLFVHRVHEKGQWKDALTLGLVFALESVAGYQQYAVYAIGFALVYWLLLQVFDQKGRSSERLREAGLLAASVAFSFLVALPQWVPFLELARFSSRRDLTEAFAYVGSMSPLGPLALFLPSWQGILGTELYAGILGVFFVFFSIFLRKEKVIKTHWGLLFLSLALAWGEFSPVYVALVKITGFYGFRIPAKFLFFTGFSLAAISAWGVEQLLTQPFRESVLKLRKSWEWFVKSLVLLVLGVLGSAFALRFWRDPLTALLEKGVEKFVVGRPYRPHSLEVYQAKLHSFYGSIVENVNPLNPWLLTTFVFFIVSCGSVYLLTRQKRAFKGAALLILFTVLYLDLYAYGFRNIRGDYESFASLNPPSGIVEFLKQDPSQYRIYQFGSERGREFVPLASNSNILEGIESIGIYSPFAFRNYKHLLNGLGSVDDSLTVRTPTEEAFYKGLGLLRLLNVKYVISGVELSHESLEKRLQEGTVGLYEIKDSLPRHLFMPGEEFGEDAIDSILERAKPLPVAEIRSRPDRLSVQVKAPEKGFFLTSETFYPGWRAKVDGKETNLASYLGLFRRVKLSEGEHRLEMIYRPSYQVWTVAVSVISLGVYGVILAWQGGGAMFVNLAFVLWNSVVLIFYFFQVLLKRLGG